MRVPTIFMLVPLALAVPTTDTTLVKKAGMCNGRTLAHLYGFEDGCWTGFRKFSYEFSEQGCASRVANTDGRVHYVTADRSGACARIQLTYYKGREATGDSTTARMSVGSCLNINTGWPVESIQMDCLSA